MWRAPSNATRTLQALSPDTQIFDDPESPADCASTDRSEQSPEAAAAPSANGDASLLMLLIEASNEIDPKTEPEPLTPVDSVLPPHSATGFQAPTPGTRNHTQELLAGRGSNATAGLPPRANWSSPMIVDRGGAPARLARTPLRLLRAPCSAY